MKKAKGIIFDFNGTLVFDQKLHDDAWREYLRRIGENSDVSDQEFLEHMHGRGNDQILDYFVKRPLTAEDKARMGEEKEAVYREICTAAGASYCLLPHAAKFLDELKERGVPFVIATSSCKANVDYYFENPYMNIGRWFDRDRIIFSNENMPCKPKPDIYLYAASQLGLAPEECVVFEDAPAGIESAQAAGMGAVWGIAETKEKAQLLYEKYGIPMMPDYAFPADHAETVLELPAQVEWEKLWK